MALHFDREEFDTRRRRVLEAMAAQKIDALLLFKQEKYVSGRCLWAPARCQSLDMPSLCVPSRSCEFLCFPFRCLLECP